MTVEALARPTTSHILWDVVQEHLDEAEFLYEQWSNAFHSPTYPRRELASTLERRLEAHLDGLVVGGRAVAEQLLIPELANTDAPARSTVAALALLAGEHDSLPKIVIDHAFASDE